MSEILIINKKQNKEPKERGWKQQIFLQDWQRKMMAQLGLNDRKKKNEPRRSQKTETS